MVDGSLVPPAWSVPFVHVEVSPMPMTVAALALVLLVAVGCGERTPQPAADDEALATTRGPVHESAPEMEPLVCTIRSPPTCELGSAPKVTVASGHQSNAEIYLVGSLSGSTDRMRYPYCYFEVTGPDGKSAVPEFVRDDPFVNVLREKDFIKVPPGGTFDPYDRGHGFFPAIQLHPSTFRKAQEYRIRFVYSTKSEDIAHWRGDDWDRVAAQEKRKIAAMFGQVPKVEVTSNEVKVTVVEPDE